MQRTPPAATRRRTQRCLLLSAAILCWASQATLAQEPNGQRVLLIENGRDPFLERVGAEVEALGFMLVRSASNAALETAARTERAVAALRVLPSRKGVEVWMADATSGRSLLRQMVVDENPGGPNRELIALQTAELLRTALLGKQASEANSSAGRTATAATPGGTAATDRAASTQRAASSRDKPAARAALSPDDSAIKAARAPDDPATDPAGPSPDEPVMQTDAPAADSGAGSESRDTDLQLKLGALIPTGGVGAGVQAGLSLQHFLTDHFGVALDVDAPLGAGTITGVEGSSTLATYAAGAALLTRLEAHPSPLFVTFGAGAAAMLVKYEGETSEPLRSTSGSQLTAAAYLRADAGIALTPWFRLGVRALAGVAFRRIAIEFAGNHAGDFGPVLFSASVLAGLAL